MTTAVAIRPSRWAWLADLRAPQNVGYRLFLWFFVAIGVLIVIVPLAVTVALAFSSGPLLAFPIPGITLENYRDVLSVPGYLGAIGTSLVLALAVVATAGTIGTLTALGARRIRSRWLGGLVGVAALAPVVFPSLAFGLGLFLWVALIHFDANLIVLFLGHVVLGVPFVARTVAAGLEHLPPEVEKAARSLGAGGWYLVRRVTLPMISTSLVSASVFAFWISFDNFTVSYFLSSPERKTIPIQLLNMASSVVDPRLAAGATLLLLVSLPLLVLLRPVFSMRAIRDMW